MANPEKGVSGSGRWAPFVIGHWSFVISPHVFPTDAARCGLSPIAHRGQTFLPRRLHLTGWRWLMEYRAADEEDEPGDALLGDVPANHGLYTPLVFDLRTGALLGDASLDWWAGNLPTLCRGPRREDAPLEVEELRPGMERVIFLNTLDYVFGHSLLLLLNAGVYLDRYPDHGLIVVVTPELRRFVPAAGVAEVWTLRVPPGETRQWHANLDARFAARVEVAEAAFVARALPLPGPERYNLRRHGLTPAVPTVGPVAAAPTVLFTYRGTRLWGGSWSSERRRLAGLGKWLRRLWPAVRLEIVGHAPLPAPVPGWTDATRRGAAGGSGPDDYDADLLRRLGAADLVLGVHGSNLLLPSAVAPRVIELVPLDKYASLLQATLFDARRPLREHLWRRRYLHGNGTMNDLAPRGVALLIHAMISMDPYFAVLQGGSDGRDDPGVELPDGRAEEFRQLVTPAVRAWRERERRLLTGLPWATRLWQWLRRQGAERD